MTDKINSFTFTLDKNIKIRIDNYLSHQLKSFSRSKISKLIKSGHIQVNNMPVKPSYQLEKNDRINARIPDPEPKEIIPQPINLDIIYEDDHYIVVNKQKNITVHPGAGIPDGTIVNGLMYYTKNLSSVGGAERPGLVHRLDKDTTGALICAKNDEAHWKMAALFSERKIYKEYRSMVWGVPPKNGLVEKSIARSRSDRKKYVVSDVNAKYAKTEYEVLNQWNILSYLKIILHTGRTHQIRVHMKYLNCPVIGDRNYGNDSGRIKTLNQRKKEILLSILKHTDRQLLHSYKLSFSHPFTGKDIEITAPLAKDFRETIDILNQQKEILSGY